MSDEMMKMPEPIRAFAEHAKAEGHDTAYTYDTERSRWVFLNPMTADLWRYWQEATRQAMEPYNELLMAVARKYTGETRHQTALRYIQQAERSSLSDVAAQEVGK